MRRAVSLSIFEVFLCAVIDSTRQAKVALHPSSVCVLLHSTDFNESLLGKVQVLKLLR